MKEKHYLGLEYCQPNECGQASRAVSVGKRLGELLDGLSGVESLIHRGELTGKLWELKVEIIDRLKDDGWIVKIPKNKYKVTPPKKVVR